MEAEFHAFLTSARMEVGGYFYMPVTLPSKEKSPEAIRKKKEWAPKTVCPISRYYDT
jgi:hypothetical protein